MTIYVSSRITGGGGAQADTLTVGGDAFPSTGPRWARWVDAGSAGVTGEGAISPATGGEYSDKPGAVIDLSSAISMVVGRQVTQNQTFRISHLSVMLENDDQGDNNEESLTATGRFRFYGPNDHRVNAYQAYRNAWKAHYSGASISGSMLFGTDGSGGDYKALRCGLSKDWSGEQVPFGSVDPFTDVGGSSPNLAYMFDAYDAAQGMQGSEMSNRLWLDGRTGHPEAIQWSAYNRNSGGAGDDASSMGFHMNFEKNPLKVMCGLLHFSVDTTVSDDFFSFDDEYHIRIGIGIDGYGGEF